MGSASLRSTFYCSKYHGRRGLDRSTGLEQPRNRVLELPPGSRHPDVRRPSRRLRQVRRFGRLFSTPKLRAVQHSLDQADTPVDRLVSPARPDLPTLEAETRRYFPVIARLRGLEDPTPL